MTQDKTGIKRRYKTRSKRGLGTTTTGNPVDRLCHLRPRHMNGSMTLEFTGLKKLGTTTHRITYPIKNSGDEKWKT